MTKYLLFAHFNGDEDFSSIRSSRSLLETTEPTYKIQFDQLSELKFNTNNTITGKVMDSNKNGVACSNVTIQITKTGQSSPTIKTTSAGTNGTFSITFKPTEQGEYTFVAIANAENGYLEGRDTMTAVSGMKESVLTIKTDNSQYIANQTITLIISLSDEQGTPVANENVSIFLDESTTPLFTQKTNKNGSLTISHKLSEIGEHYFTASFGGNASVKPSSTNIDDCHISILRHKISVTPHEVNIYPNWKLRFNAVAEDGTKIKQTTFKTGISGNGKSLIYYPKTNDNGYMETPALDLGEGEYKVRITGGPWDDYDVVDTTLYIQVLHSVSMTSSVSSVTNLNSNIPYRVWQNLSNVTSENGSVAQCGKKCTDIEAIAGRNGSYNTPAPLGMKHNVEITSNSTLTKCVVGMKCKTVSCSSDSAKPKITAPTAKIGSKTQLFTCNTSDNQLPYKNLGWVLAEFDVSKISVYDFDNTELEIIFPANANTNTGLIQIDHIYVLVEFIPQQVEGE